jgi:hypothetical protein
MDIRSDILHDCSSSAKQILHRLQINLAYHRDQSERGPLREVLVACVKLCLYPSHHCRDSRPPGPAAPSRGGRSPVLRRRPGAVEARPRGAVEGRSGPGPGVCRIQGTLASKA